MKFPPFAPIDLKSNTIGVEVLDLLIDDVVANVNQPRKQFDQASLQELALSIKQHGVIQPIVVRRLGPNKYEIIAGERRWRACALAGLKNVPALIRNYSQSDKLAIALIENIQRKDLNPLEEAQAIQSLIDECDMTHHKVAESLGKSRTTVTNLLRLLQLPPEVKVLIHEGKLEMGHARALLSLNPLAQHAMADSIVAKKLSVRETEKSVQKLHSAPSERPTSPHPVFKEKCAEWEKDFSAQLLTQVALKFNQTGKGHITIHFKNFEEADWIMKSLTVEAE